MTKRILFVDDEHMVLRGIERSLRGMQHEWHLEFLPGGPEALEAMERAPFDVVITDMRMPGMDGAQLLKKVKERFPQTVRMVLSGQSDRATILRSVGPTHQYLSKPCEVEELKQKLVRALSLRDLLDNPTLKEVVSRLETVPSSPDSHSALSRFLKSNSSSISDAGQIIARDMGMTAKVLQLVNSAFLGSPVPAESAEKAVSLIGLDNLRALTLSLRLFVPFQSSESITQALATLWDHSWHCAQSAKAIAKAEESPPEVAQAAYTAGLLHDIGILVLASACADEYEAALRLRAEKHLTTTASELQTFGSTHAQVGGYLLGLWGLPASVVEAVAWHHDPAQTKVSAFSPLIAVHVASVLDNHKYPGPCRSEDVIDERLLEQLGLKERLPVWTDAVRQMKVAGEEHVGKGAVGG